MLDYGSFQRSHDVPRGTFGDLNPPMATRAKAPAKPFVPPPSSPKVINSAGENEENGAQASAVSHKKLTDLTPDRRNANLGTERGGEMIRASLADYGAGRSLVADKHLRVIGGNKTLEQAGALGMDDIIVVQTTGDKLVVVQRMDLDLENDAKAKELAIADNRAGQVSLNWDPKVLAEFRAEIDISKFWNKDELVVFFAGAGELKTDEDDVPPTPAEPRTRVGDLYVLGGHRLLCGDSTKREDVERLMGGHKADMLFTDPPYGVSYQGGHNEKKRRQINGDALEGEALVALFRDSLLQALAHTGDHAAFYIWFASGKSVEVFSAFGSLPLSLRAVIQWYKIHSGLGAFMAQYIPNAEPCLYAHKSGHSPQWFGPSNEKTVWELQREGRSEYHPTQKPVGLAERALANSTRPNQIVLDLFAGSGSTMIAAEKIGRRAFSMELSPAYTDVCVDRWEAATSRKAVLHGSI